MGASCVTFSARASQLSVFVSARAVGSAVGASCVTLSCSALCRALASPLHMHQRWQDGEAMQMRMVQSTAGAGAARRYARAQQGCSARLLATAEEKLPFRSNPSDDLDEPNASHRDSAGAYNGELSEAYAVGVVPAAVVAGAVGGHLMSA